MQYASFYDRAHGVAPKDPNQIHADKVRAFGRLQSTKGLGLAGLYIRKNGLNLDTYMKIYQEGVHGK